MRFTAILALVASASAIKLKLLAKKHAHHTASLSLEEEPDNQEGYCEHKKGYQTKDKTQEKMFADLAAADQVEE